MGKTKISYIYKKFINHSKTIKVSYFFSPFVSMLTLIWIKSADSQSGGTNCVWQFSFAVSEGRPFLSGRVT